MAESTSTARIRLALDGAGAVEQGLAAVQSRIGGVGQALLGLAGGASLAGFAAFIKSSINAADEMSKLSQSAGIAVEQLAGLQLAFKQSGLEAGDVGSNLAKLNKNIADGSVAFAAMGISVKNADGSLKGTRQVLGEVADRFAVYEDGAAKARLAQELFGKSGAAMIPLLNGGAAALDEFDAIAQKLGLTLDTATAKQAERFNDTLDLVGQGVQGVGRQIAAQLLPTLSGLAGQFFESMTQGDRLRKVADFLSTGLKGLYIVALGVVEAFNTVAKAFGGVFAAVVAAAQGDFRIAGNILSEMKADIGTGWTDTLAEMEKAWNTTGDAALESMAATTGALKRAAPDLKAAEEATKAAAKATEDFIKLRDKIVGKEAGTDPDFAKNMALLSEEGKKQGLALEEITRLQGLYIQQQDFMKKQLAEATKLAEERQATLLKEADAIEKAAQAEYQANVAKIKGIGDRITGLQDELEAEKLAISGNMSLAEAIERVTIARLEEKKAMLLEGGTAYEDLQREIDKRRELLGVIADKAQFDQSKAMWESVDRTAKSVFVNVFENGSNAFKRLGQTLKAAVLDLLYQMTIKKWIINIGASVTGSTSMASTGQGASGFLSSAGNLLGVGDSIAKVYSAVTGGFAALGDSVAFAAQDIGAWLTTNTTGVLNQAGSTLMQSSGALGTAASYAGGMLAGYSIGKAISGQYTTGLGKNTMEVAGTAIGAVFGGPIGAAIGGAIGGLVNRAFGMGAKSVTGEGISGSFSADSGASVQSYSTWFQKGGWFRSNKSGTNWASISTELDDFLDAAIMMTAQATRQYAQVVGLSADAVSGYTKAINISLKGLDQAGREKAIAAAISGFGEDLANLVLGEAGKALQRQGETAANALVRLASALGSVNDVLKSLGQQQLGASLGGASNAQALLDLFGGLDAYTQVAGQYLQAFYSESERVALAQTRLRNALAQVGVLMPSTIEGYRQLVDAQDLTTERGQRQYAALMQLAPAFQEVTQAATAAAEAARQQADAQLEALVQQRDALIQQRDAAAQSFLQERDSLIDALLSALGRTQEQRARELAKIDPLNRPLQEFLFALEDARAASQALADSQSGLTSAQQQAQSALIQAGGGLSNFINQLRAGITGSARNAASAYAIDLAAARGGDVAASERLPASAQAYLESIKARATNATQVDIAMSRIAADLEALPATKSYAQQQLDALQGIASEISAQAQSQAATKAATEALQQALSTALEKGFSALDINTNGLLTFEELKAGLGSIATDEQLKAVITALDTNSDGQISKLEAVETATTAVDDNTAGLLDGSDDQVLEMRRMVAATDSNSALILQLNGSIFELTAEVAAQNEERRRVAKLAAAEASLEGFAKEQKALIDSVNVGIEGIWNLARSRGVYLNKDQGAYNPKNDAYFRVNNQGLFEADYDQISDPNGLSSGLFKLMFYEQNGVYDQTYGMADDLIAIKEKLEAARQAVRDLGGIPQFADGGLHTGGLRMVGERGPELEVTGPARYLTARQTIDALSGRGNDAMVAELKALRTEVQALRAEARSSAVSADKTARILDRVTQGNDSLMTQQVPA